MTCGTCEDAGLVLVNLRKSRTEHGYEEFGPCPYCPAGKAIEFPEGRTGRWGDQGFWRGRTPEFPRLKPSQPMPAEENRKMLDELTRRMA